MTSILLALAISIDSLGIGIAYGMQRIKVSIGALLVVVLITLTVLTATWFMGGILLTFLPVWSAKLLSSSLLIALGVIVLFQALLDYFYSCNYEELLIKKIRLKHLRLVINIIREPAVSDFDHSGVIEIKEAFYIGTALAIDAVAIGLIAAAYEVNLPIFLSGSAFLNFCLLKGGEFIGRRFHRLVYKEKLKILSGTIIIFMGIIKLI